MLVVVLVLVKHDDLSADVYRSMSIDVAVTGDCSGGELDILI